MVKELKKVLIGKSRIDVSDILVYELDGLIDCSDNNLILYFTPCKYGWCLEDTYEIIFNKNKICIDVKIRENEFNIREFIEKVTKG